MTAVFRSLTQPPQKCQGWERGNSRQPCQVHPAWRTCVLNRGCGRQEGGDGVGGLRPPGAPTPRRPDPSLPWCDGRFWKGGLACSTVTKPALLTTNTRGSPPTQPLPGELGPQSRERVVSGSESESPQATAMGRAPWMCLLGINLGAGLLRPFGGAACGYPRSAEEDG